jgi:hypothetical protein
VLPALNDELVAATPWCPYSFMAVKLILLAQKLLILDIIIITDKTINTKKMNKNPVHENSSESYPEGVPCDCSPEFLQSDLFSREYSRHFGRSGTLINHISIQITMLKRDYALEGTFQLYF